MGISKKPDSFKPEYSREAGGELIGVRILLAAVAQSTNYWVCHIAFPLKILNSKDTSAEKRKK